MESPVGFGRLEPMEKTLRLDPLETVAKIAAVAALYAYLLLRAGIRPSAVAVLTSANAMALFCCAPISTQLAVAGTFAQGACSYAILAVDHPWPRALVVVMSFLTLVLFVMPDPQVLSLLIAVPLAIWAGLMVIIKDWARNDPIGDSKSTEM